MGQISLETANIGQSDSTEEPKLVRNFTVLQTWANGNIDTNNLAPAAGIRAAQLDSAVNAAAGINDGTTVRRGKSIVATTGTRTNTAYGALSDGPDQVAVALERDGLIAVAFQATWRSSGAAPRAAIFVGPNQLKVQRIGVGPVTQAAVTDPSAVVSSDTIIASFNGGLFGCEDAGLGNIPDDVATGQVVGNAAPQSTSLAAQELGGSVVQLEAGATPGGPCYIFAAAGTYTVSVQFKLASGTVSVKNRKLWVWTAGF